MRTAERMKNVDITGKNIKNRLSFSIFGVILVFDQENPDTKTPKKAGFYD